jgi:hypothetical protein
MEILAVVNTAVTGDPKQPLSTGCAPVTVVIEKDSIRLLDAPPRVLSDLFAALGKETWRMGVGSGSVRISTDKKEEK